MTNLVYRMIGQNQLTVVFDYGEVYEIDSKNPNWDTITSFLTQIGHNVS